jgi:hypothetical protein
MRILLLTPLYPPDIAQPAPYVKELARRLAREHEVVVLTYGRLPERAAGVRTVMVDKRLPLPLRLLYYTLLLLREAYRADAVYAENGASVELPLALVAALIRRPLILHIGDSRAYHHAQENRLLRAIARGAQDSAQRVLAEAPPEPPEILPFEPRPDAAIDAYEASWRKHLEDIASAFNYA